MGYPPTSEVPVPLWLYASIALADPNPELPPPPVGGDLLPPSPTADAGEEPPALLIPEGGDAPEGIDVASGARTSQDVVLYVRSDGNVYVDDEIVIDRYLSEVIERERASRPQLRIVVEADAEADYGRVNEILQIVRDAGVRAAIVMEGVEAPKGSDPLFPGSTGIEGAERLEGVSEDQLKELKPKRWKFEQNPYASVDFTAYTLEWGEAKIGLGGVSYGIAPRVQIGTNPIFDAVGVFNGAAKINVARQGPLDLGVVAQGYYIPIVGIINTVDELSGGGLGLTGGTVSGEDIGVESASLIGLGGQASLRLAKPWSLHGKVSYLRVGAKGTFNLLDLPDALIPGLSLGKDNEIVPSLQGDLVSFQLATDVRFNRRDSLVAQFRGPLYVGGRGVLDAEFESLPQTDLRLIVAGSDYPRVWDFYAATLSWQFQWKHVEARIGGGISAPQFAWLIQAFDISYRFGGKTRKEETTIRRGFRENVKDLETGGDKPGKGDKKGK